MTWNLVQSASENDWLYSSVFWLGGLCGLAIGIVIGLFLCRK